MPNFSGAKLIEIIDSKDKIWSPHYRNKLVTETKITTVQGSMECKQNDDCVWRPASDIHYS